MTAKSIMNRDKLPQPLTPFVGRARELAEIGRLLADPDCRLLTLVGPGGIGKTRLALAAAAGQTAVFVELQSLTTASQFPTTLADALGISHFGQAPMAEEVKRYLADKSLLLLLDNCEAVLDVAEFIVELLVAAPEIMCLATSRAPLNLREEWLFPVGGMAFPADGDAAEAMESDAVQFFASCARRMQPGFSLADEHESVLRICRLTEGMPLALELAAAWARTLPCAEIADEIEYSLAFLETEMRNVPDRHRSLQAVFEQTWQQLPPRAQQVFARLSVFRGGFSREAARTVAGASLSVLSGLMDLALLRRGANGRYYLHELLRQYGLEQLTADPQEAAAVRGRHRDYFADFLQVTSEGLFGGAQVEALDRIQAELDNVRAAWQLAVAEKDGVTIHKMEHGLSNYFQFRGRYVEPALAMENGIATLEQTAVSPLRDETLAMMHLELTWLNIRFGRISKAQYHAAQAQTLFDRHDILPPPGTATDPLLAFSLIASVRGSYEEAYRLCQRAYDSSVQQAHVLNQQYACYGLAGAALGMGELKTAAGHAREGLAICDTNNEFWMRAYLLNLLGSVAMQQGELRAAKAHFEESYQIRERFHDPEGMAVALNHLGEVYLRQQAAAAREIFSRSLALYREINDRGGLATALVGLGQTAVLQAQLDTARRHFVAALKIGVEIEYISLLQTVLQRVADLFAQAGVRPSVSLDELSVGQVVQRATAVLPQLQGMDLEDVDLLEADGKETAAAADSPLVEPLTERELEVLQHVAQGKTNQQIADTLVISLGTVKWYTGQIYGKLNVSNRTQAVARAQELAIL